MPVYNNTFRVYQDHLENKEHLVFLETMDNVELKDKGDLRVLLEVLARAVVLVCLVYMEVKEQRVILVFTEPKETKEIKEILVLMDEMESKDHL